MEKEIKEELCCPICTDLFQSPLRLPCGHSYCRKCLEAMVKHPEPPPRRPLLQRWYAEDEEEEDVKLSCPECRRPFILNQDGVDRFQADFKLAKLVDLYKKLEMTSLTDSESEEENTESINDNPGDEQTTTVEKSVTSPVTCEVLSNIPTELCSDTLVKQVGVDTEVSVLPDLEPITPQDLVTSNLNLYSGASATATAETAAVPQFQENYFAVCCDGESGEVESCKSVETGEVEGTCHGRGIGARPKTRTQHLDPEGGENLPLIPPPSGMYDNVASTSTSQNIQRSRHGSQSPKFSSGNYDNVIDSVTLNSILTSVSDTTPTSALNVSASANQRAPNRQDSNQSISSSTSRSSKSANENSDKKRKRSDASKGAVSLACNSKQTSDDSKRNDSSDNDVRMTTSAVVMRRKRKKKKNRVASFFSSLLFSDSSSDDDYVLSDSDEELKRQERNRQKERGRIQFYSSSSS